MYLADRHVMPPEFIQTQTHTYTPVNMPPSVLVNRGEGGGGGGGGEMLREGDLQHTVTHCNTL